MRADRRADRVQIRRGVWRRLRFSPPRTRGGRWLLLSGLAGVLLLSALLSVGWGSQSIPLSQLPALLWQPELAESPAARILRYVRIPRTLAGMLSGGALAMAGVLIQGVLHNPMASPNVIGVNAGAGFFAMAAVTCWPHLAGLLPAASFLGALLTAFFIFLLAAGAGLSRTTLILAGVAVSSILTAGVNALTLLYPDDVVGATGFLLGGFSGVTTEKLGEAGGYLLSGAVLAVGLAPRLNLLQLGEESAAGLGLPVTRVRLLAVLATALLAGGAVSFSGLLGFVGLLVPHMARRLIGEDNRWLLPAALLLGGAFVLLCDLLARVAFAPFELPVGIVMSLLGGPFFLSLLLQGRRNAGGTAGAGRGEGRSDG